MKCPKCKADVPDQAVYCIHCNADLPGREAGGPQATEARTSRAQEPEPDREEPKSVNIGGFVFSEAEEDRGRQRGGLGRDLRAGTDGVRAGEWQPPAGHALPLQRLGAFVLDFLFLGAASFLLTFVLALGAPQTYADLETAETLSNVLSMLLSWGYYAVMESSRMQATPGKLALGIKVVDLHGRRLGFGRATARHFAKIISGLLLMAGYIMILFTRRRQGLHDMMAGCLVVRREEDEVLSGGSPRP